MNRAADPRIAQSVHQRLLNHARAKGEDFQIVLQGYLLERFLYRLGESDLRETFALKGAVLLRLWADQPYRATVDLDLLWQSPRTALKAIEDGIRAVAATKVEDDGVTFDARELRLVPIRADQEDAGFRASLISRLGQARLPLQIDIGTGVAWPLPQQATYPTFLDQPAPQILAYAPETVIAEKLEAMIVHGIANSRIKDFFDLHYLSRRFAFEGERVVQAINRTFEQRGTRVPTEIPIGLTDEFWQEANRVAHLRAFARRAHLEASVETARALLPELRTFLLPPLDAVRQGTAFTHAWPAGGPWSRGGILEALRRSPLVGADAISDRPVEPGRKVDL